MKYYIIAGEASGDMHAASLMHALKLRDPQATFRCWGGDLMQQAGGELVRHYRDLAYMGFVEVALHLRTILGNLRFCKQDILDYRPDALILVDYPGFNLRIAEFARKEGLRVIYYISPQVWAWKKSRVYGIRKNVDKMMVILPFEEDFYRQYDYPVDFVGHPLLDVVSRPSAFNGFGDFVDARNLSGRPVIALLPGSRKQEIRRMLPVMASLATDYPEYEFVIAGAPSLEASFYAQFPGVSRLRILFGMTHELLRHAHAALVTSGTATLETALFAVPQVVCYKGSAISFAIARRIVDVKFISLPNLVMDRQVVRELIQHEFHAENLKSALNEILEEKQRLRMANEYRELRERLGGPGASGRAADQVMELLKS